MFTFPNWLWIAAVLVILALIIGFATSGVSVGIEGVN